MDAQLHISAAGGETLAASSAETPFLGAVKGDWPHHAGAFWFLRLAALVEASEGVELGKIGKGRAVELISEFSGKDVGV